MNGADAALTPTTPSITITSSFVTVTHYGVATSATFATFESLYMSIPASSTAWVLGSVLTLVLFTPLLSAQESSPGPMVAPSGRVTTSVAFDGRLLDGATGWFNRSTSHSGPSRMTIDYGQPHARGRTIFGGLVPYGEVWRLGANWATSLTLDVKVRIGDLDVPRGLYTLFLLPSENGAELIVNRQTRQWGTDYDPSLDLGRTSLRRRSLPDTVQSLAVTLEPIFPQEAGERPGGTVRITWGEVEFETDWRVIWP